MIWFMLQMLMHPFMFLATIVPLAGMGAVYAWAYCLCRGAGVERRAARWALIVSWLSLFGWMIAMLHAITVSTNSTAMLGVMAVPLYVAYAVVVLPIAWAASVVALSLSGVRPRQQRGAWTLAIASVIVLLTAGAGVHCAHDASLRRAARVATSPEKLLGLYARAAARHDAAALDELAANTHTPPGVLATLASDDDEEVRYRAARNPSTPGWALERLYDEPRTRAGLAVNPSVSLSVLRRLAADSDRVVRWNLLFNPSVPTEVLEELTKDPTLGQSATAMLRSRTDPRHWLLLHPPYEWAWFQRCTAIYADGARMDQWITTGHRFGTQLECESLRAELVRREQSPGRRLRWKFWRCEPGSEPLDRYSHARCVYRAG